MSSYLWDTTLGFAEQLQVPAWPGHEKIHDPEFIYSFPPVSTTHIVTDRMYAYSPVLLVVQKLEKEVEYHVDIVRASVWKISTASYAAFFHIFPL